jgi:sugar phosphate isomerase/epimerase
MMGGNIERIAIEFISVLGMHPVEFVHLTADLGCRHVGMGLTPIVALPDAPTWSMRDDAALRREVAAALKERDVSIAVGEGFLCWPNTELRDAGPDIDLLAELGARRVNMVALDPDPARCLDQAGAFAELAGARGLDATVEFLPNTPIGSLLAALKAVADIGRPNFSVLVDMMHLVRSGGTAAELAAADPALIGHVQICDVPLVGTMDYGAEAAAERLPPGEGELPLLDLLAALPAGRIIGIEVPMMSRAIAGATPRALMEGCVAATLALMDTADARRAG